MRRRFKNPPPVTCEPRAQPKGLPWDAKLVIVGATVAFVFLAVAPFAIVGYLIWRFFQ